MSSPTPPTDLAAFRAQLDIVGLTGKLTEVVNAGGRGAKIRCPFHDEGSASCYLYPEDNHFHCFGCGAHGSVMDLVAQLRGVSFGEAIEWCAETSNVPAPVRDPREAARAAGLRAVRSACAEERSAWGLEPTLAEKLGLGRGHDLLDITTPLAKSPLRADEAVAFEGAPSVELHHRSGITGIGFFADVRTGPIELHALGPLSVASGAGRPALVALGAARETVREEYLVVAPTPADALRLQAAGVRGAVSAAGALDLTTAQLLASLVPEVILAVASGTPTEEAVATLNLLARAGLRSRIAAMRADAIGTPVPTAAYLARLAAKIEARPLREALLNSYLDALLSPSTRALYEADFRAKGLL